MKFYSRSLAVGSKQKPLNFQFQLCAVGSESFNAKFDVIHFSEIKIKSISKAIHSRGLEFWLWRNLLSENISRATTIT